METRDQLQLQACAVVKVMDRSNLQINVCIVVCSLLWIRTPSGNLCKHRENMQIPHFYPLPQQEIEPRSFLPPNSSANSRIFNEW